MAEAMTRRNFLPAALPAFALFLAGCASTGRPYPSLERRPAERESGSMSPVAGATPTPEAPPMQTTGLAGQLDSLLARAQAADREFRAVEPRASRAVAAAAGSGVGSESWSLAQVQLAQLESARSNAMIALADLDAMYVAAKAAEVDAPSADVAPIEAVRNRVIDLIAAEDDTLSALRGRVAG
jgi:hypothetical protein